MKQLLFSLIFLVFISSAYGELTNINEVTDLFDKHIENKDELLSELKTQNNSAIDNIKSGAGTNSIEGINEAESKASELKNIEEIDLENKGREKRASKEYQFYDENELEPNYTKSGNRLHKLDAEDIVNATEESMRKLGKHFLDKLKAVGVDCHTVKGPIHKEPTYYIEIKRENQNNTEYDQFFCEELRNKYNCRDTLTAKCVKLGKRWNPWQYREIDIGGYEIYHQANHLGYSIKWKRKRHGWHLVLDSAGWRTYLSQRLNIPLEQIHEQIHFPAGARGVGRADNPVGERWRIVFDAYRFGYNYRDGYEVCEEWSEDWSERCNIK